MTDWFGGSAMARRPGHVSVGVSSHLLAGAYPQSQLSAKWRSDVIDPTSDHSSPVKSRYALPFAGKSSPTLGGIVPRCAALRAENRTMSS